MPIFKKAKALFIHIPKTGGTSVEKELYLREKPENRYNHKTFYSTEPHKYNGRLNYSLQHFTLRDLKIALGKNVLKAFKTVFSIVRNPFDRLVSEFHYRRFYHEKDEPLAETMPELREQFEKWCFETFRAKEDIYD